MKKIMSTFLVALALSLVSGVSAGDAQYKYSPESIVSCLSSGIYSVGVLSIAEVNIPEQCSPPGPSVDCATCITALEAQGCRVVDVDTGTVTISDLTDMLVVNYLLSCDRQ